MGFSALPVKLLQIYLFISILRLIASLIYPSKEYSKASHRLDFPVPFAQNIKVNRFSKLKVSFLEKTLKLLI